MSDLKLKLILASQSPRRKELLSWLEIPFEVIPSDVEEKSELSEPTEIAEDLAKLKGHDIVEKLKSKGREDILVVAADTLVCLKGKIYGKPQGQEDARRILNELSGQTHEVITSLYLGLKNSSDVSSQTFEVTSHCQTLVSFANISSEVMEDYLNTKDSLDKAGAYGIQGPSLTFIKGIQGSYSNVVGLPLYELRELLTDFLSRHLGKREKLRDYFEMVAAKGANGAS